MPKKTDRAKRTAAQAAAQTPVNRGLCADAGDPDGCTVVGVGASAGGLEAIEQFIANVPPGTGLAFVIIQHMDPTRKGMLPELIQRTTTMPVLQADDGMVVAPDRVYVIPPNKEISILHGVLRLLEPTAPRGLRLPIDLFLRALAEDRRDRSIGVILSGMGSDGTLGLRAIKEAGGLALVQDPTTSKFDGMPRSAIDAGVADIIAPAEALPRKIVEALDYARRSAVASAAGRESSTQKSALDKIMILLRRHSGQDFSLYKKRSVYRRIERRMALHKLEDIDDYVRFLSENPQEVGILFRELLIGVTGFFRDAAAWTSLSEEALPTLLAERPPGSQLRAWVVGCSTGEEAYSLAIAFREALQRLKLDGRYTLQIFATDIDHDAIDRARAGFYPANIAADVAPLHLAHYFVQEGNGYRIAKEIREMIVFATQNVVMDPPFSKLDILTCRNLLIYLGQELQVRLLPLFHFSLNPGGLLFLGSSETVGNFSDLFVALDARARIYQRRDGGLRPAVVDFSTRQMPALRRGPLADEHRAPPVPNLQTIAERLLLQRFLPPAVMVNSDGDIVYISGRTGRYLEPAAGKANWNIHAMAREGLRNELMIGLSRALRNGETVVQRGLRVEGDGSTAFVDLHIHPIDAPQDVCGMAMVVFDEVEQPAPPPDDASAALQDGQRTAELEYALKQAREELQAVREEMQTREEELKCANEELQSTNEELQSANEELTTSKEEMQSLNEELQTINAELQARVDELSAASNDMKNLLDSTEIATIFLDDALRVRRFTARATGIFKLIPGDVGRPLSDIVTELDYAALQADAQEVLRTLVFCEKEVAACDGRWFKVRIMPYRTVANVIEGLVITLSDISVAKHLEAELRKRAQPAGGDVTAD